MYPVVGIELLLQLYNGLIALIQTGGQRDHDVSLFEQELLVTVDLCLLLFYLSTLTFHLL
jgi:hypothetical protein